MISVCIATYNGEQFIKEQIMSIIPQLQEEDEIIISDDGSTDNTISIIKSINVPNIKIFYNTGEHGYTPNFENALRLAKGDFIFLSDQDDIWTQDKIKIMMGYMEHHDMVISDADIIDRAGNKIFDSYFQERGSVPGLWNNLLRFSFLGCSLAFRKEILNKALPFPPNHRFCTHDNWLGIVAMTFYRTIVIKEILFHYRRHETNTSAGGLRPTTSLFFKLSYRLYLLKWLIKRWRNVNKS